MCLHPHQGNDRKRLNEAGVVALFMRLGAFHQNGHFVYAGGEHGDTYLDKKAVLADPEAAAVLAREMVLRWLDTADAPFPEIVAGPADSGAEVANGMAVEFNRIRNGNAPPVIAISIQKDGKGGFSLTSEAAEAVRGRTVLLGEDILNTAQSLLAAARAIHEAGGRIIGAIAYWNRGGVKELVLKSPRLVPRRDDILIPFSTLVSRTLLRHQADACPYCRAGVPINIGLGHGAEFVQHQTRRP